MEQQQSESMEFAIKQTVSLNGWKHSWKTVSIKAQKKIKPYIFFHKQAMFKEGEN